MFSIRSELNLGIQPAGFTVVKSSRFTKDTRHLMKVMPVDLEMYISLLIILIYVYVIFNQLVYDNSYMIIVELHCRINNECYPQA